MKDFMRVINIEYYDDTEEEWVTDEEYNVSEYQAEDWPDEHNWKDYQDIISKICQDYNGEDFLNLIVHVDEYASEEDESWADAEKCESEETLANILEELYGEPIGKEYLTIEDGWHTPVINGSEINICVEDGYVVRGLTLDEQEPLYIYEPYEDGLTSVSRVRYDDFIAGYRSGRYTLA